MRASVFPRSFRSRSACDARSFQSDHQHNIENDSRYRSRGCERSSYPRRSDCGQALASANRSVKDGKVHKRRILFTLGERYKVGNKFIYMLPAQLAKICIGWTFVSVAKVKILLQVHRIWQNLGNRMGKCGLSGCGWSGNSKNNGRHDSYGLPIGNGKTTFLGSSFTIRRLPPS